MEQELTEPGRGQDGCYQTMALKTRQNQLQAFFPMLQRGVTIKATSGCSLKELLCEQIGIDEGYVTGRITTIFLDNRPIDDLGATIAPGARVTLSAAMPGLVGAVMRRSGFYAALRQGISHAEATGELASVSATVTLKLFNLLLQEVGPIVLSRGIILQRSELDALLSKLDALWIVSSHAPAAGQEGAVLVTVNFME